MNMGLVSVGIYYVEFTNPKRRAILQQLSSSS